eukprot:3080626-Prorocentrum_lima.AAC.1
MAPLRYMNTRYGLDALRVASTLVSKRRSHCNGKLCAAAPEVLWACTQRTPSLSRAASESAARKEHFL